jgi:hypothetical protein
MVPKSQSQHQPDDKSAIVVDDFVNDSHATSFYGVPDEDQNVGMDQLEQVSKNLFRIIGWICCVSCNFV